MYACKVKGDGRAMSKGVLSLGWGRGKKVVVKARERRLNKKSIDVVTLIRDEIVNCGG